MANVGVKILFSLLRALELFTFEPNRIMRILGMRPFAIVIVSLLTITLERLQRDDRIAYESDFFSTLNFKLLIII